VAIHPVTIHRLTTIAQAVRLWPFFREGIAYEAKYLRYDHPIDVYRQILWSLIKRPTVGWVSVVFDDDNEPVAFVLAHDVTPLHADRREFEVSMFYYKPGHKDAIRILQNRLDEFCRENGIHRYYLSTSSFCSTAERVFKTSWRFLERSNTVFKREIS
jgi:hypothetical protein